MLFLCYSKFFLVLPTDRSISTHSTTRGVQRVFVGSQNDCCVGCYSIPDDFMSSRNRQIQPLRINEFRKRLTALTIIIAFTFIDLTHRHRVSSSLSPASFPHINDSREIPHRSIDMNTLLSSCCIGRNQSTSRRIMKKYHISPSQKRQHIF